MSDRNVRARLVIDYTPESRAAVREAAKDTADLTKKTQELAKAHKQVGSAVGDMATMVDRIVRHPGAKQFGLSRGLLAQLPAEVIQDMAGQLGIGGGGGGRGPTPPPPPVSRSTPRPGDVFGLAPLDAERIRPGVPRHLDTYGVRAADGSRPSLGLPPPMLPPKKARVVQTPEEVARLNLSAGVDRFAAGASAVNSSIAGMSARALPMAAAAYAAVSLGESMGRGINRAKDVQLLRGDDESRESVAEQRREFLRETMPGFDRLYRFGMNVRGMPARMEDQDRENAVLMQSRMLDAQRQHAIRMEGLRQRGAEFAAGPLPGALSQHSQSNLLTAAGEKQFKRESDLIPIQNQRLNRERELNKARSEAVDLEGELTKLTDRQNKLRAEEAKIDDVLITGDRADEIRAKIGQKGLNALNEPDQQKRRAGLKEAIRAELDVVNQQAVGVGQRLEGKKKEEAELKAATREDRLRERETKLGHLREDFEISKGSATNFGIMRPFERQRNVQALEMVMQMGIDNASPEMIAQAREIAPRKINELALEAGRRSPEFARVHAISPEDAPLKDLGKAAGEIGKEANEVIKERQKIADDKLKDMAAATKKIAEIFGDAVNLMTLLKQQMEDQMRKIREDANDAKGKQAAANQGGRGPN